MPFSPPVVALVQPADQPAEHMVEAARRAEAAGIEEIWLWEDCFAASGIAPAAAILASTRRLRVGIGLMPVPLRAPSLAAMEIAALARMYPGRFLPGLGHGVQDWMEQVGERVESPVTLLAEHVQVVRDLLHGRTVTTAGRYTRLKDVALRFPPHSLVPPVLVGGRGPKTLAVAGELADGVILDDVAPQGQPDSALLLQRLDAVDAGRRRARLDSVRRPARLDPFARRVPQDRFEVVTFLPVRAGTTPADLARRIDELSAGGATRVAAFVGGVDGPPDSGEQILRFIPVLAEAAQG